MWVLCDMTTVEMFSIKVTMKYDDGFQCGHCKRYRATGSHRATVDVDVTPPTGGPVGHPPIRQPCVTAVRREVNRDTQGHLQNTQT